MARVALIGENSIEYVEKLLDIWNNGDCAVLIDWRIPSRTAYRMMREAGATGCCIERRFYDSADDFKDGIIAFDTFETSGHASCFLPDEVRNKFRENDSESEAVILYSSGTTGAAKGVVLSHYAINANAEAILDYMSLDGCDCLYIAKSLSHAATLTGELLVALKAGARLVLAPTVVPPRYVLNQIAKFDVSVLCLNPTLLQRYAEEYQKKQYHIGSLEVIYVSGAILNDAVYSAAHETFKDIDIFNVYGLSEAGPRVTAQTKKSREGNSVGRPIKGVKIAVIGDDGSIVQSGERGIVHVDTPSRFLGYVSGEVKHGSLYNNWLNTGDIGFMDEHGELHIVGRIDDVIIYNAHKIYPRDIEDLVLKNNEIKDCAVVECTYNDEKIIGCLYVSDADWMLGIIRQLNKALMAYEIPKRFVRVEAIPRNSRGKVDKKKVIEILSL